MNMHGIMVPAGGEESEARVNLVDKARQWLWAQRMFVLIVLLPTLLVGGYLYLIASDQYQSEAHFLVRTASNPQAAPSSGVSQALGFVTGGGAAQSEAMSVADYLMSHDVVDRLRSQDHLVERFHRSEVDPLSRLRLENPTPEKLLQYYRKQIKIRFDIETGITTLEVRSFTPKDSFELTRKLLELGEQRVNMLNIRSYNDSISTSRKQLGEAEAELAKIQLRITQFRQNRRDIDPETSGRTQIGLVSSLTGDLAAAKAQLNAVGGMISHSSPQYRALAGRVSALQAQVSAQSGRLTGGEGAIANDLSSYQALQLREAFLSKRYEATAASMEKAREEARRQHLYVVRIVDANMPVKALYPERGRILITMVIALLLAYSIGWLIAAGVKEHAV